jgi:hypothetical protein
MSTTAVVPPKVRARPSGWWYALVPILFFVGIGFGIAGAIDEGRSVIDSFSTLGADGRGSVALEEGQQATVMAVWPERQSTDGISRPPATVSVTGPSGTEASFDQADGGSTTYSFNSSSGIDLGSFTATEEGTYDVRVTFDTQAGSAPVPSAAVGRLDIAGIAGRTFRPIGWGALAAVGLWILLLVTRGASKRRQLANPQQLPTSVATTASTSSTRSNSGPFV